MYKLLLILMVSLYHFIATAQISLQVSKGQKWDMEYSSHMTSVSKDLPETNYDMQFSSRTLYKVADLEKDEKTFEKTITWIRNSMLMGGENLVMDSDSITDKDDVLTKSTMKDLNKTVKIKVDNNGVVKKEERMSSFKAATTNDMSWMGDNNDLQFYNKFFSGKIFTPGMVIPFMDTTSREKPSTSFTMTKDRVEYMTNGIYTVTEIKKGIAHITFEGTQQTTSYTSFGNKPSKTITNGTVRKEIQIEIRSGLIVYQKEQSEFTTQMPGPRGLIESVMKSSTLLKLTPIH